MANLPGAEYMNQLSGQMRKDNIGQTLGDYWQGVGDRNTAAANRGSRDENKIDSLRTMEGIGTDTVNSAYDTVKMLSGAGDLMEGDATGALLALMGPAALLKSGYKAGKYALDYVSPHKVLSENLLDDAVRLTGKDATKLKPVLATAGAGSVMTPDDAGAGGIKSKLMDFVSNLGRSTVLKSKTDDGMQNMGRFTEWANANNIDPDVKAEAQNQILEGADPEIMKRIAEYLNRGGS
tara:strand:+ start:4757 stop:5464 length:708 start_codon:yes stop_codon:yes gene_type:complete